MMEEPKYETSGSYCSLVFNGGKSCNDGSVYIGAGVANEVVKTAVEVVKEVTTQCSGGGGGFLSWII
jgi:predicted GH43/DUF377 family glycosyl hydrolase